MDHLNGQVQFYKPLYIYTAIILVVIMSSTPRIILFCYELSPFSHKVKNILLLKKIPFSTVKVNYMLPRPEINDLGIGYRRIPVLAIDNDVYCDTSLIVSVLEKRFPASSGYD